MKTWKQLAQEALDVQYACNLSGVVHSFARAIGDVRANLEAEGTYSTDDVNRHPVCVLWADKVAHLSGTQSRSSDDVTTNAYRWATNAVKP